jgi:hypothetical protein
MAWTSGAGVAVAGSGAGVDVAVGCGGAVGRAIVRTTVVVASTDEVAVGAALLLPHAKAVSMPPATKHASNSIRTQHPSVRLMTSEMVRPAVQPGNTMKGGLKR